MRVADDELAQSIYTSMVSIDGLRPCDFTLPNFPACQSSHPHDSFAHRRPAALRCGDENADARLPRRRRLVRWMHWGVRNLGERWQLVDCGGSGYPCSLAWWAAGPGGQLDGPHPRPMCATTTNQFLNLPQRIPLSIVIGQMIDFLLQSQGMQQPSLVLATFLWQTQ